MLDKRRSKQASIVAMISLSLFLNFMDIKDLYYKATMCGPNPSWSFSSDIHEEWTGIDLTEYLNANNGTRLTSHNQWNALASVCDSLILYKLVGKFAHLSAAGTGCVLGTGNGQPVKRNETLVFIASLRIDAMVWGGGLLADTILEPFPVVPYTSSVYSTNYNLPEASYREDMAALVTTADVPSLLNSTRAVFNQFATRMDLWEDTICYEIIPLPAVDQAVENVAPSEYGCIWSDPKGERLHEFHVEPVSAKYFRMLSEWVGWNWHTLDYIYLSNIYMRARLRMISTYSLENIGTPMVHHWIATDLGVEGVLFFAMLLIELCMIVINSVDSWVVAMLVVRPLLPRGGRERVYASNLTSTSQDTTSRHSSHNTAGESEMKESAAGTEKKDETLSRILLYTDLSSVSLRKRSLAVLIICDTIFSWLYVVPNSTVFAWSTNWYQVVSAFLSNFRVWTAVVVLIDTLWRVTFVLFTERLAALITELTYISSFEIMICTLFSVLLFYKDILNVCLAKWGGTDRQREMFPTVPGLWSFYNSYSKYSYGDRSRESIGAHVIFDPLVNIIGYAMLFSFLCIILRLLVVVAWRSSRGTLRKDVESFWRTYQRNSVEVFMNDPLRAKALIRSQSVMSYRFGRSVFIRPFVYLEQNYYIHRGKFRARPLLPIFDASDAVNGAEVNAKSYKLEGVYHDEATNKMRKKRVQNDTQIPLC